jgi:hypothetical protein
MPDEQLVALLVKARAVLERHLFEPGGELIRDDIAEVCMAIDDVVVAQGRLRAQPNELERSAA